ncbi:MAG: T9SS type A sorting domain-containing protein [Cyclobacteriaceae bacterium]
MKVTKQTNLKHVTLVALLLIIISNVSSAQFREGSTSGPLAQNTYLDQVVTYKYSKDTTVWEFVTWPPQSYPAEIHTYSSSLWEVVGGQVLSTSPSQVRVKWNSTGTKSLKLKNRIVTWFGGVQSSDHDTSIGDDQITLNTTCSPRLPDTGFTVQSNCSNGGTITRNSNSPDSNVKWYWQTSPNGTSKTNSSSSYTIANGSNPSLYLRAYLDISCSGSSRWSSAVSVQYTLNAIPSAPVNISNDSRCGPGVLSFSASPGVNANQVRWYSSSTGGSLLSVATNYNVFSSINKTVYVESYNSSTGCKSSRTQVNGSIYPIPSNDISQTVYDECGEESYELIGDDNGLWFISYNWYDSPSGGNLLASGDTYETGVLSGEETFYAEAFNALGCQAISRVAITVYPRPEPQLAQNLSASIDSNGDWIATGQSGAHGSSINWYYNPWSTVPFTEGTSVNLGSNPPSVIFGASLNTATGCEDADRVTLNIGSSSRLADTSLNEFEIKEEVNIYPNPVSDKLFVSGLDKGAYKVLLYSLSGTNRIESSYENTNEIEVDVSVLSKGFYFLKIIGNKVEMEKKIYVR